eukprot:SAG25_NODE_3863_length_946_cov_0.558442_1_plen_80_part_10
MDEPAMLPAPGPGRLASGGAREKGGAGESADGGWSTSEDAPQRSDSSVDMHAAQRNVPIPRLYAAPHRRQMAVVALPRCY